MLSEAHITPEPSDISAALDLEQDVIYQLQVTKGFAVNVTKSTEVPNKEDHTGFDFTVRDFFQVEFDGEENIYAWCSDGDVFGTIAAAEAV